MSQTLLIQTVLWGILLALVPCVQAQTITWAGHSWKVTSGGMAGVAQGNPANVKIDSDGHLHLQIINRDGKWTAAEVFTTDDMRFGTYQWIVEGNIYQMDPTT